MEQLINGVGLPLLVSAVIAIGGQYVNNRSDSVLLQENLKATKEVVEQVNLLNTRVGILFDRSEREKKDGR